MRHRNITSEAVRRQIDAMGADVFEVGLFKPDAAAGDALMIPRIWDRDALARSIPWLRYQNREGRNIYVRPAGEHDLTLIDDLSVDSVGRMKTAGFPPALVVETSPRNFQAWLKHPHRLDKELGTAVARVLAVQFGGDQGAADWRHYGRLSGFANRKETHRDSATGLFPFVKLIECGGEVYPAAHEFLATIRRQLEQERQRQYQRRFCTSPALSSARLKSIEEFRADPRYCGDGKRTDLAYAVYAVAHGLSDAEVEAAIRSRDLSHKGSERRQDDYVQRTIRKALDQARKTSDFGR